MKKSKSTAIYRRLLQEAWKRSWQKKTLWIFGLFASLVTSGGVLDAMFVSLEKIKKMGTWLEQIISGSFPGYETFARYIQLLSVLGTQRVMLLLGLFTAFMILLIVLAIFSQGMLLSGVTAGKSVSQKEHRGKAWSHWTDLLVLSVIAKVARGLLSLLVTLPLALALIDTSASTVWAFFFLMLGFIPLLIIVNTLFLFSSLDVVRNSHRPVTAMHHALQLFRRQWLAAFEYGLLLFLLLLLIALCTTGVFIIVFAIPYSLLYAGALFSGSQALFVGLHALFLFLFFAALFWIMSFTTVFQYHAWALFYERSLHKTHGVKSFSKLHRLFLHSA